MGNKESQFNGGRASVDGREKDSQTTLDPSLIKSFTEFAVGDTEQNLEKFQVRLKNAK